MIAIDADLVQVEDGDTAQLAFETPLVVDSTTKEVFPRGQRDASTGKKRYEVRHQGWVRFPNLDTHESYTEAGKEETAAFEDWMGAAEDGYDSGQYELVIYHPTRDHFSIGSYGRILAMVARKSDGDDWETSAMTKFGNSVAWREQTPE